MIKLNDLLNIQNNDFKKIKIRFNLPNGVEDPLDVYLRNPDTLNTDWLFWRTDRRLFRVGEIAIGFLKLRDDFWLLTTIKRITKELGITNGVNYEGEELEEYKKYFGRVIIHYHKREQRSTRNFDLIYNDLIVSEVLPDKFDGDEFPGYSKVCLSFSQLHSIISKNKRSWIAALENQKAVYLITDKLNGKLYVGSATSDRGMLLARWSSYANNGHGGNVELKKIPKDYIQANFQYSILENYNANVADNIILERESWWKETLQSRKFGYNSN